MIRKKEQKSGNNSINIQAEEITIHQGISHTDLNCAIEGRIDLLVREALEVSTTRINSSNANSVSNVNVFSFDDSDTVRLHVIIRDIDARISHDEILKIAFNVKKLQIANKVVPVSVTTDITDDIKSKLAKVDACESSELEKSKLEYEVAKASAVNNIIETALKTLFNLKTITSWYSKPEDYVNAIQEVVWLVKKQIHFLSERNSGHEFDFFHPKYNWLYFRINIPEDWIDTFLTKNKLPKEGWNRLLTGNFGLDVYDLPFDYTISHVIPRLVFATATHFKRHHLEDKDLEKTLDIRNWTFGIA